MTTAQDIAASLGGTPAHCEHSASTYCRRCDPPLHCWMDAASAFQFPDARSVVSFARDYGAIAATATRTRYARA